MAVILNMRLPEVREIAEQLERAAAVINHLIDNQPDYAFKQGLAYALPCDMQDSAARLREAGKP